MWNDSVGAHPHLDIVTPGHIEYAPNRAAAGYELAKSCYFADKSCTVDYSVGPPIAVANVSAP